MRNGMIEHWGTRRWHRNGKYHREDGPAIEYANGDREWWINGKIHRLNGPAFETADGDCEWWVNGVEYTEEEYRQELRVRKWGLVVDA